jgi:hypothetical protein
MTACRWDHSEKCANCGSTDQAGPRLKFLCSERGALCLDCWMHLPACHCGLEDFDEAKAVAAQQERP